MPAKPRPGERHIRAYLRYLNDPTSALDEGAVIQAQRAIEEADESGDPIRKAMALSGLERAQQLDGGALEEEFVGRVVAWAEGAAVTYNALRTLGVPAHVLARAGMESASDIATRRPRTSPINLDDVYERLDPKKPFHAADVGAAHGRDAHLARGWLRALTNEGRVICMGPDPSWAGKGRAPLLYRKAKAT